jgi:hypothetical protein
MKSIRVLWAALLLSSCSLIQREEISPQALLTPYVASTALVQEVEQAAVEPTITPEPTLAPTPFVHVLGNNETISSLALTYNLGIGEILAVNPEVTPNALSVGTQILIPYIGSDEEENEAEVVISEPLPLAVSPAECILTADGGLWCTAEVQNATEQDAAGITVTFVLKNAAGETEKEQTAPTLLNYLKVGASMPVSAFFSANNPAVYSVETNLTTALPLEESALSYQPVAIKVNSVDTDGRSAQVSAVIPTFDADSGVTSVWLALIAYDKDGNLVGMRRMEYTPVTEGEEGQSVKLWVYSSSEDIKQVSVLGEAVVQ